VQDKQDALSMVALEFASDKKEKKSNGYDTDNISTKLKELEQLLEI